MRKPASNKLNIDTLCKMAKVETLSDFEERITMNGSDTYSYVYKQAQEEGKSESEAEEAALVAEGEEIDEASGKYYDAVIETFNQVFAEHKLVLKPIVHRNRPCPRPYEFRVVLAENTSWREALDCIRHTINGVGMWEFRSASELADSIPATYRSAVLSHLHWTVEWFDVYEGSKMRSVIERRLR